MVIISGLQYDPLVLWQFLTSFLIGTTSHSITTYSQKELQTRLSAGSSLIRMGDGEVMLMTGRDIHYQSVSKQLAKQLHLIIDSYTTDGTYILSLPVEAVALRDTELRSKHRFRIWRLFRVFFSVRMNDSLPYADAHLFYHQNAFETYVRPVITDKHVICVSKKDNLTPQLVTTLKATARTVHLIENPSHDAYDHIDRLIAEIDTVLKTDANTKKWTMLVSSGPAGKVLAHHYATRGIQTLDIGHGLEIIGQNKDYSDRI